MMEDTASDIGGTRALVCTDDGPPLSKEGDANAFMSAAWAQNAVLVAIPVKRLSADSFRLGTRLAGEVVQKLANYRLRFAIVGDVSAWTAKSKPLRDFIYKSEPQATRVVRRRPGRAGATTRVPRPRMTPIAVKAAKAAEDRQPSESCRSSTA